MRKSKQLIIIFIFGLMITRCSINRIVVNHTASILVKAMPAFEKETNIEFAEQSIGAHLKLIEGLLELEPDNSELLLLVARGYTLYTFGFVEEKIDVADKQNNDKEKNELILQASDFYSRAQKYGFKSIFQSHSKIYNVIEKGLDELSSELKTFKRKDVPELFWTAFAWGRLIYLKQNEPALLASLPKVELIMQRVLELDESYYFGGVHLFYGAYYGGRPVMFGGDLMKAKQHLQRAVDISQGRFLMAKLLFAQYYAIPVQDRELFEITLQQIISAPPNLFPEQSLTNQLAKKRAKRWIKNTDEFFF
jgi:hypothetical protein